MGNPCNLGSKALDMILFSLKKAFGNKHGHHDVFVAESLESRVEILLNVSPNCIAVGSDYHAALKRGILGKLCLSYNIGIPFAKSTSMDVISFTIFF